MTRWPLQLLLLLSVAAATITAIAHAVPSFKPVDKRNKTALTVGYLTAIKGELKDKQGLAISGALTYALDEVF